MPLFKKKLDEQEAAISFVGTVLKEAKERWPKIYQVLKESPNGEYFIVENEDIAKYDLALAAVAQGLQVVKNLFTKDQSERIELFIFKYMFTGNENKDWNDYAIREVKAYQEQFQKALQNIKYGEDPTSAIPGRLVQRWLGINIERFLVELNGVKTNEISPISLLQVGAIMATFPQSCAYTGVGEPQFRWALSQCSGTA